MSENPPTGAVFLSYAREDSDAAKRIADAMRAFGLEVWFDQSELRGGDAWDMKIKKQIRDCTLFMPIISATTQDRGEGYFRREWKLGVERTHDMAAGVPFIVPVVIDDTPADEASVPEEFMRYQWTVLKHGVPSSQFVDQVKSLLQAPKKAAGARSRPGGESGAQAKAQTLGGQSPAGTKGPLPWVILSVVALVVAGIIAALLLRPKGVPQEVAQAAPPPSAPAGAGPSVPAPSDHSVAVLPFENMSEDKDTNAFFADGIHEDILTNLALIKSLRVVSRTSVMQYRSTTKPIRQIAQELGVSYILEGSVQRAGNKVRVTGQLIRAATDEHIWAKAYDRDITDIFAIQGELAQAIADALQTAISPEEKTLIERRPTENAEAYDLFLKARKARENLAPWKTREDLLRASVELDPKFAVAWAALAEEEANAYFNDLDHSDSRLAQAKEAMETANRLAPDDPDVIENTGSYYYYGFHDYAHAAEEYRRLATLRPNDPVPYYSLGLIYRRQGNIANSIQAFRRAVELDPADLPHSTQYQQTLFYTRHYDEGEALGRQLVKAFPDRSVPAAFLAVNQFMKSGSTKEAEAFFSTTFSEQDRDVYIWSCKILARMIGNYPEVVRLDREHPRVKADSLGDWGQDVDTAVDIDQSGDHGAAVALADTLLPVLTEQTTSQPENSTAWAAFAELRAIRGEKDLAISYADKACAITPVTLDALNGTAFLSERAAILLKVGEKEQALAEFRRLLRVPFGTNVHVAPVGSLFNCGFTALNGDPRFDALLSDPANNAPLN